MSCAFALAFLVTPSATDRLVQRLSDNTFAGIHQLAWFDWAMLIPYFTVLAILSVYGIHRYEIIHTYFKHRKKAMGEPPRRFDQLPKVTIQLPLYNERYVVERLIEEVVKIAGLEFRLPLGSAQIATGQIPAHQATVALPEGCRECTNAPIERSAGARRVRGHFLPVPDAQRHQGASHHATGIPHAAHAGPERPCHNQAHRLAQPLTRAAGGEHRLRAVESLE